MNIKSDETYRLSRELAAATGESLTKAVTIAVRERLDRVRGLKAVPMAERLMAIGRDCAPRLKGVPDHSELLYGENGLPR